MDRGRKLLQERAGIGKKGKDSSQFLRVEMEINKKKRNGYDRP